MKYIMTTYVPFHKRFRVETEMQIRGDTWPKFRKLMTNP